ncbi:MAG: hypothetical protein ACYTDV_06175 [Planctomycetota bacterium]
MLSSNTNKLLKAARNEAWSKKRTAYLRALQYAGTIVMAFSLIAMDGKVFRYQISVDQDILLILLLVGIGAMFVGYYERRMIAVVRAIKDTE